MHAISLLPFQVVPDDKAVGRKLYDDAMFKLEHGGKDKDKGKASEQAIKKISAIQGLCDSKCENEIFLSFDQTAI